MTKIKRPVMLVILDGFGIGNPDDEANAVVQAHPENFNTLWQTCPHTQLEASGLAVGLPEGQMGNSEVGHLNLGAGRVVDQSLTRITKDLASGTFFERPVVKELLEQARKTNRLQLLALLSNGGVHSELSHVEKIIERAHKEGIQHIYVHAFLDGRDVAPKSAQTFIKELEAWCQQVGGGQIATVGGRYYGMDRDHRWERTEKAYKAIVLGKGLEAKSAEEAVEHSYAKDITDEFVVPTVIEPSGCIQAGDAVLVCNFRPDRVRQITRLLSDVADSEKALGYALPGKDRLKDCYIATMTRYEDDLPVHIVYDKELLPQTLGQVLADNSCQQLRIAETEKYAHVTYFFNGGREEPFAGESRILVPSPKVATYDLQPEMSAPVVTDKVVAAMNEQKYDMIILNFANPDMVGHTGNLQAAEEAIRAVDAGLAKIVEAANANDVQLLITADHGNSEVMVNHKTGAPHTAHTVNKVPLVLYNGPHNAKLASGALCDIAPTMLALSGLAQPKEMTGQSLLRF